jgi:hypothetical protein
MCRSRDWASRFLHSSHYTRSDTIAVNLLCQLQPCNRSATVQAVAPPSLRSLNRQACFSLVSADHPVVVASRADRICLVSQAPIIRCLSVRASSKATSHGESFPEGQHRTAPGWLARLRRLRGPARTAQFGKAYSANQRVWDDLLASSIRASPGAAPSFAERKAR